MKKIYATIIAAITLLFTSAVAFAQPLTGIKNIPVDYATLADAITALNVQGVGTGGVTLNLMAGNPETAPAGGYVIGGAGTQLLTTTSSTNQVIIEGNGNTITAFNPQAANVNNDAIFKIIGADFITLSGFTMQENALNAVNGTRTEFGVALFYATTGDGAQNNTIIGNTISLVRTNVNTFGIYSNTRHSATNVTALAAPTLAVGANSFNKVYSNNINNVNYGIIFSGSSGAGADNGNDIGGSSAATGNSITDWGSSGGRSTNYIDISTALFALLDQNQMNENVSYNTIISSPLLRTSTTVVVGISKSYSVQPSTAFTSNITNNKVTVTNNPSFTTPSVYAINNNGINPLPGRIVNITDNIIENCRISGTSARDGNLIAILSGGRPETLNITGNMIRDNFITASGSTLGKLIGIDNRDNVTNLNITNNTLRNFQNTSPANTGGYVGITNSGAVVNTITISNNNLGDAINDAVTYTASGGISNGIEITGGASTAALNVTGNIIRGLNFVQASSVSGILTTSTFTGSPINISNNTFGAAATNFVTFNGPNTTNVYAVNNQGGSATGSVTISGNNLQGLLNQNPVSSSYFLISNMKNTAAQTISDNTFTNLNINTTGNVTFIDNNVTLPAGGSQTINNNIIVTAFNKSEPGGVVRFYSSFGASPSGTSEINTGNNFSNVTVTGATIIEGWRNHDGLPAGGPAKTISNNNFSNITGGTGAVTVLNIDKGTNIVSANTVSNISSAGAIDGIVLTQNILTSNVSGNIINTFVTSGAANVNGINVNGVGTTTNNIFKNKICNLQLDNADGAVNGILVVSGATNTIYNNLIGDLKAPTYSGSPDAIRGINIISTMGLSTINVYYNTIYLNASSTGTDFGTTGLYATASATTGTATLDLRNNIIYNISEPKGTGYTAAYKRSGIELENYAVTSDRNLFYAGSGPNRYIAFDQLTFYPTLVSYQSDPDVAPREANSVSGPLSFLSTTCGDPQFLHLPQTTIAENAGTPISGITDDYDGNGRSGTSPDIGADETIFVVPIAIEYFRGSKQSNRSNLLEWKVNVTGSAYATLILERSADGRNFNTLYTEQATSLRAQSPFSYTDAAQLQGTNFYRVKMADDAGRITYSAVIALLNKEGGFEIISLSPNPVKTAAALNITSSKSGIIKMMISDILGKQLQQQTVKFNAGSNLIPLNTSELSAGTYLVTVITEDGERRTNRFIKQ